MRHRSDPYEALALDWLNQWAENEEAIKEWLEDKGTIPDSRLEIDAEIVSDYAWTLVSRLDSSSEGTDSRTYLNN